MMIMEVLTLTHWSCKLCLEGSVVRPAHNLKRALQLSITLELP